MCRTKNPFEIDPCKTVKMENRKIRKRGSNLFLCGLVVTLVISGSGAHLLPQALEDVHAFVQSELQQRSQGDQRQLGIDGPPQGGPHFQTTYVGTPVIIQNEVSGGNGGFQKISEDLSAAQTQNIGRSLVSSNEDELARGLVPPLPPMIQVVNVQETAASSDQPQIIPTNIIGPSTFVTEVKESAPRKERNDLPRERNAGLSKTMEGWVPIDNEGTSLAKGVGVKVQGDGDDIDTTTIQLNDLVIGTKDLSGSRKVTAKYPVYPGNSDKSPKVVIHAQNVIIRDGRDERDPNVDHSNNASKIRQFPAYSMVPQLNNYLRDQLRMAAMNQLIQSHPLNSNPFPRPLSLREIAQAARNGQFPQDLPSDPLLQQASLLTPQFMALNIPHVIKMNRPAQDPLSLASMQSQSKYALPGFGGLGNLVRNMFNQEAPRDLVDPREPLDYSLLAQLSGQRLKVGNSVNVPTFKSKPGGSFASDYGDSVGYTGKGEQPQDLESDKEPIQIVSAVPAEENPVKVGKPGSLRQVSDELLKQMIIEELQASRGPPLLPSLSGHRSPLKSSRPLPYGSNAHPFAFLANPDSVRDESYEYSVGYPPNPNPYMEEESPFLQLGGGSKRPNSFGSYSSGSLSSLGGYGGGSEEPAPLNKDMLMQFGKGLFYSAMDFSKKHNPMTLFSKIRSLPPVKFEFYKTPVGVPDGVMEKLPERFRGGRGGGEGGKRGRRNKNLPRKNNQKFY